MLIYMHLAKNVPLAKKNVPTGSFHFYKLLIPAMDYAAEPIVLKTAM